MKAQSDRITNENKLIKDYTRNIKTDTPISCYRSCVLNSQLITEGRIYISRRI